MRAEDLQSDCARCVGLCCVAPAFSNSSDFAINKPAGRACPNLQADFRCGIHAALRERGFAGCAVYDCFGAGQHVTQITFGGQDWRRTPAIAADMFRAFGVMRQLHELMWYLVEAIRLVHTPALRNELQHGLAEIERLTESVPEVLLALDVDEQRRRLNPLLLRASALVRGEQHVERPDYRGAELVGKDLRTTDLQGASLRGAWLIGANFSGAHLKLVDLTGADVRGADFSDADLTESLFVTQSQLDSARGNAHTQLPPGLTRPRHW